MLKTHFPRLHDFAARRLSPEGAFGLHLTVGMALLIMAAWAFGSVAEDVMEGDPITVLDAQLANALHADAHASHALRSAMLLVTHWHSTPGMLLMVALAGGYLYARRAWYWLLALGLAVPGGMLLNVLLKLVFQRPRPLFDEPLVSLATYSFPSGHTVAATLLYGFAASFLACQTGSWRQRAALVLAACLMVALVAFSRMYLGAHYLSDILAAIAEGCAWLATCITAVSTLRRRHEQLGQPLWRTS